MEKSNKKLFIGLSITALFIISATIVYINNQSNLPRKNSSLSNLSEQKTYNIPIDDNFSFGSNNPQITIIEFADFNCPHCKKSYSTIRELGYKYKDVVKIVFKDYPVIQENSADLALAARCAGEQGFFWGMHDKLFTNQGNFTSSDLPDMATKIGANKEKYNNCVNNKKYLKEIEKDLILGQEIGLKGTPKFFVNGYLLPKGDIPMEDWEKIIQFILTNSKK